MAAQAVVKEPLNSGSATAGSGLRRHDPRLWVPALGLAAVCLLALALRSLGFEWVFVGDSDVVLLVGDGQYHARRAFYSAQALLAIRLRQRLAD